MSEDSEQAKSGEVPMTLAVALSDLVEREGEDFRIRNGADVLVGTLRSVDETDVVDTLCRLLPASELPDDWRARYVAARLLGTLGRGRQEAGDALRACFKRVSAYDSSDDIAEAAAISLGELGETDPRTLNVLTGMLQWPGAAGRKSADALVALSAVNLEVMQKLTEALDLWQNDTEHRRRYEDSGFPADGVSDIIEIVRRIDIPDIRITKLLVDYLLDSTRDRTPTPRRAANTLGMLSHLRPEDMPSKREARQVALSVVQRAFDTTSETYSKFVLQQALDVAMSGTMADI